MQYNDFFKNKKCLVTGGAGFIGSHLVETLTELKAEVRVFDNLSTGKLDNISSVKNDVDFIKGDIRDKNSLTKAMQGRDFVFHLAANPSVEFSVRFPSESLSVNFTGTQNVIETSVESGVKKLVFSSSCAIYGNLKPPLFETLLPDTLSPYAVAKRASELLLESYFYTNPDFKWTALRYFNVFGQRQDPFSPYGAVIPKFISATLSKKTPIIFGDGLQTRDFVYVKQVVNANLRSCFTEKTDYQIINVGNGNNINLIQLLELISEIVGYKIVPEYQPERTGDVKHSFADTSKMKKMFGENVEVSFKEAMQETIKWYSASLKS